MIARQDKWKYSLKGKWLKGIISTTNLDMLSFSYVMLRILSDVCEIFIIHSKW